MQAVTKLWVKALRLTAAVVSGVALMAGAAHAENPHDSGTTTVAIEYAATPQNRVALRQYMEHDGIKQLEQWKKEGFLRDYKVLFNRYVDNQNWDMLTLLNFQDAAKAARWKEVERTMPAGLPPAALALVKSIDTNPADLWLEGGKSKGNGAYVVIPYDYLVSTDKYVGYLKGYLVPQLEGWMEAGALSKYSVYLGRYVVGRHWSSLLILEYNGDEGLGLRERTTEVVRKKLNETNPAWVEWSKDKGKLRVTRQYIIADELSAK